MESGRSERAELREIYSQIGSPRDYFIYCAAMYTKAKGEEIIPADIQKRLTDYMPLIAKAAEETTLSRESCRDFVLNYRYVDCKSNSTYTPKCLSRLAAKLMDIQADNTVADLCCGDGGFFAANADELKGMRLYGCEYDTKRAAVAAMRCDLLGLDCDIVRDDVFNTENKFDRIFSNFPFGFRVKFFENMPIFRDMRADIPDIKLLSSGDWVFVYDVMANLRREGRAVCMMTAGDTVNSIDADIRRYFVESGCIESVILLPPKLLEYTGIPMVMVVLSRNNDHVNFVDAAYLYQKGRRINELSGDNISEIAAAVGAETDISCRADIAEIAEKGYSLSVREYTAKRAAEPDTEPLENFIRNVTRGTQIKADELDKLLSEEPTGNRFVRLADIQDGMLTEKLPYLRDIEKKYEKYLAPKGALIITKNGIPIRMAVSEPEEGERILVNGNMYVLIPDETKLDPYFLKAYLESSKGRKALEEAMVGTTIPNLPIEGLKKTAIPIMPMSRQRQIAEEYKDCLRKIAGLKKQLDKENLKRTSFFVE